MHELDKTTLTKLIGENWEHGDNAKKGLVRQESQEVRQSDNLEKTFGFVIYSGKMTTQTICCKHSS